MEKVTSTMHHDHLVVPYSGQILDYSSYAEFLDGWVEDKAAWDGEWLDAHVRVLSDDLAVFSGRYKMTMVMKEGEKRNFPGSAWAALFERTADGWRISLIGAGSGGYTVIE